MRQFGLIGFPLGHSFSQKYFTDKFLREGIPGCTYQNYPLKNISEFTPLIKNNPALEGLNVTIPYKEAVIPFLDRLSEASGQIGAVNCIKINKGKTTGFNTDATGFERSLAPLLQSFHKKALVIGTGGAAKAVAYVLGRLQIPYIYVSRDPRQKENTLGYEALNKKTLEEYQLIVHTTPLGMHPKEDGLPSLPYEYLTPRHLLYDLVYNPAETLFLKKGKEKGAVVKNGEEMLALQAEASWEIWNS